MITLTVGPNKSYSSIQSAINAVVASTAGGTLSQDVLILVYEANYGGFIIPASMLGTSSTASLTIKAAPNQRVVLSGWNLSPLVGHGHRGVGIGIGDNNPYVTIKGLRVENFHKGIVLGAKCDNSKILSNYVQLNTNVGVWLYRSDNCQISNNVILDHDNGLVCSEVDDVFIANNDISNLTDPPGSAQGIKNALHLTTRAPSSYGSGGAIILYNNNIVSSGGRLISYGPNVLSKLRSDNNNLYNPGGAYSHDLQVASSTPDTTSLAGWQTISNGDAGSVSVPAPYYIPSQVGSSIFTSVNLENYQSYGGIGVGLSIANAPTASTVGSSLIAHGTVPSYADAEELSSTIQSNYANSPIFTRPATPSIGAYDTNNDPLGFGSSIQPVGVPGSGVNNSTCIGGFKSGVNTVEEKYEQSVDCITPSIVPGYFYIRDIQHYLYSSKVAHYISDITVTDIVLASPLHTNISIRLDDNILDKSSWRIKDNVLRLYHKGLDINDFDKQVEITATILKWTVSGFDRIKFRQVSRIRDGHTRYFLPYIPTRAAPIVITDDMISYSDEPSMLGWEFKEAWDDEEEKVEITFAGSRNLIENPQFDYIYTGATGSLEWTTGTYGVPDNWGLYEHSTAIVVPKVVASSSGLTDVVSSGALGTGDTIDGATGSYRYFTGSQFESSATGVYDLYPVIGNYLCILTGDGIVQRIRVDENMPYWISTYASALKDTGSINTLWTGDLNISLDFYDIEMRSLTGSLSTGLSIVSNYSNPTGQWNRYSILISNTVDNTLNKTGVITGMSIPADSYYMDVSLGSTGGCALDGVSVTQSIDLESYRRRIRGEEGTIEYDTGDTDLYHVTDLTLTPIRNRNHNGFMYIAGVPAWQFDTGAPTDTTTLTDWGWANGRLKYLPWARTSGKNKLRSRPSFNLGVDGQTEDIAIAPVLSYPDQIQIIPRIPVASLQDGVGQLEQFDGNVGIKGSDFTVRVTDDNGNPYGFEWIALKIVDDLRGPAGINYVGLLGHKELGFYKEFNQAISVQLDSAGSATVRWIPPSADEAMHEMLDPFNDIKMENGEYFIDELNYRVNEVGMGNAFLSSPANPTGYTSYSSFDTTEFIAPSMGPDVNGISMYELSKTPHADTMRVWINHTGLFPYTGSYTGDYNTSLYKTYDLPLVQSEVPEIIDGQYFIDEPRRLLFIRFTGPSNDPNRAVVTKYRERNTYLRASDDGVVEDRKLYLSESFYSTLTGDISPSNPLAINYDILIDILITARSPLGITPEIEKMTESDTVGGYILQNIRERTLNGSLIGKCIPKRVGN